MRHVAPVRVRMMFLFCAAVGLLFLSSYLILYLVLAHNVRSSFDRHVLQHAL